MISKRYLAILASSLLFTACATSDSETLRIARSLQDATLRQGQSIDSTLQAKLSDIQSEINLLKNDTLLALDTLKQQAMEAILQKQSSIQELRNEISQWQNQLPKLPSTEEIAAGAANPFAEDGKDQDALKAIKKAQEEMSAWQSKVNEAIQ